MLEIGSVIDGKYKILNKIGQGGMSVVYLAMNERANKQWAIKELRKDGVHNFEVVRQGLIVETDMLKKLEHPSLPSIVDVIEEKGCFLIVMDYIEGNPLSQAISDYGVQPQECVIEWAKQLCNVLGYLHTRTYPIIYRDLKPSNIMLKPDGNIMLIDFGTAREFKEHKVEDTTCLGTQGYAAPEQFGGQGQTDARTDIYCLGMTLYHLITEHNPCEPPYEIYPIRYWNPMLSSGLEQIIIKCTQKNPIYRYQSCAELLYDLEHYDEMDISYRKLQNKKLTAFILSISFALFSLTGTVGFKMAEENTTSSNYQLLLEESQNGITQEARIESCRLAIRLNPYDKEAYLELVDSVFLEDDNLSPEEDEILREILTDTSIENNTNEGVFRTNIIGYEEVSYRLGLAYFYSYEDKGNKALSSKWLDIASYSTSLEDKQVERAKRLGRIAQYYSKIGKETKSGDAGISYLDYWKDLVVLSQGNLVQEDNSVTAMMMYKELVYQIYTNTLKFKDAGVKENDLLEQLIEVSERLETDFIGNDGTNEARIAKLKEDINENIVRATRAVENTYHVTQEMEEEE